MPEVVDSHFTFEYAQQEHLPKNPEDHEKAIGKPVFDESQVEPTADRNVTGLEAGKAKILETLAQVEEHQ